MKTLRNIHDLREFGIDALTGEACNLGMRILCDLSQRGKNLICDFLGLPRESEFAGNWNSGPTETPSVASVFLTHNCFQDLAAFLLLRCDYRVAVLCKNGNVIGLTDRDYEDMDEDPVEQIRHFYGVVRTYSRLNVPSRGLSNIHSMSGRSQGA